MASDNPTKSGQILMLCTDRQIDRRILLQADSLEEAGWQVTILAMPLDRADKHEDPRVVRIGAQARGEHRILSAYKCLRRHLPMNGRLMRWLKALAWRFCIDHERFYLNLFLADARRYPADIVVAHDLPMLVVGKTLAQEFQAHLVYDSHELYSEQEFSKAERSSWVNIEQRHIHACDQVITVNPSIANELQRRYGLNKVEVIYNAERIHPLSARRWYLHEYFGIPREHPILLFQGGLSANRHLPELVAAMALLRDVPVHLVLLGDGQLKARLQWLIQRKHLCDRVHLHPAVAQSKLLDMTASADAGIIPYQGTCLNNYYCTPNKLFEFIAAALPILASDLPELRRLIHDQEIGQVADLSTSTHMAAAIRDFFACRQLPGWRNHVLAVREHLNWQHEAVKLKRIYRALG